MWENISRTLRVGLCWGTSDLTNGVLSSLSTSESDSDPSYDNSSEAKTWRLQIGHTRRFLVSHGSIQTEWYAGKIQ